MLIEISKLTIITTKTRLFKSIKFVAAVRNKIASMSVFTHQYI